MTFIDRGRKPDAAVLHKVLGDRAEARAYLVWRPVPKEGSDKFDKVPVDPVTGSQTKPNGARDRGILTLAEALEAAARFEGAGVGLFAPHADLAAIDLDNCVDLASGKIEAWAQPIIAGLYAELSPSKTGLRVLIQNPPENDQLDRRCSGHEKDNIGLYGRWTNKFVTLTGDQLPGAASELLPLSAENERAIWTRWETEGRRLNRGGVHTPDGYPPGEAGMNAALDDIISGKSLHPATMAYVTRAVHTQMTLAEIEMILHEAYNDSDAKTSDPGRWHLRYPSSINSVIRWVASKQGPQLKELPTQVVQAAQATWAEFKNKKRERPVERPGDVERRRELELKRIAEGCAVPIMDASAYGGRGELQIGPEYYERMIEALGTPTLGCNDDETIANVYFHMLLRDGVPLDAMQTGLQRLPIWLMYRQVEEEEDAAADEAQAAVDTAAFLADGGKKGKPDFELIEAMPQGAMRQLAEYFYTRLQRDMPELAVMAALSGVSAVCGGYVARTNLGDELTLDLWTMALAPSGAGKSMPRRLVGMVMGWAGLTFSGLPNSPEMVHKLFEDAANPPATAARPPEDGQGGTIPTVVISEDEFSGWMEKLKKPGKSGGTFDAALQKLLGLFSAGAGEVAFLPAQRGSSPNSTRRRVNNPYLVLTGYTTPTAYQEVVSDQTLQKGFGNRMLTFYANYLPDARYRDSKVIGLPPDGLAAGVRQLAEGRFVGKRDPALFWRPDLGADVTWHALFRTIEMSPQDSRRIHDVRVRLDRDFEDHPLGVMVQRFGELVIKVASIMSLLDHAVGVDGDICDWDSQIRVATRDVDYALFLVQRLLEHTVNGMSARGGSEGSLNAEKVEEVARMLLKKGQGMSLRESQKAMLREGKVPRALLSRHAKLDAEELSLALETLVMQDRCEPGTDKAKKGQGITFFRFKGTL